MARIFGSLTDGLAWRVQAVKPKDFAMQINLSMENCWGIVRALVDVVAAMDDGKYLLVKCAARPCHVSRSCLAAGAVLQCWPPLPDFCVGLPWVLQHSGTHSCIMRTPLWTAPSGPIASGSSGVPESSCAAFICSGEPLHKVSDWTLYRRSPIVHSQGPEQAARTAVCVAG